MRGIIPDVTESFHFLPGTPLFSTSICHYTCCSLYPEHSSSIFFTYLAHPVRFLRKPPQIAPVSRVWAGPATCAPVKPQQSPTVALLCFVVTACLPESSARRGLDRKLCEGRDPSTWHKTCCSINVYTVADQLNMYQRDEFISPVTGQSSPLTLVGIRVSITFSINFPRGLREQRSFPVVIEPAFPLQRLFPLIKAKHVHHMFQELFEQRQIS